MTVRPARAPQLIAVVVVALLGAGLLTGCGQTGASGSGQVTVSGSAAPTPTPTLDAVAAEAVVKTHTKLFVAAARAFRRCDKKVTYDSYVSSPCQPQAAALTAAVDSMRGDLRSVVLPPGVYDVLLTDLGKMSRAGARVAAKCAKANDQVCDQALATFRADEQSILWDLNASL